MKPADDITDIRTNERWFAAYFKTLGGALILIALILVAQGITDAIERYTEEVIRDREDRVTHRQWVADACTPTDPSETAIAKHDGKRIHCRIFQNLEYGMAPRLTSAAALDIPR